jgi:plastocyanin
MFGSARIQLLPVRCLAALVWLCACGKDARAQQPPVDVKVEFVRATAAKKQPSTGSADVSNVAVWLTPLDPSAERAASTTAAKFVPKLVQKNKVFEPHMLVIHVGTVLQFPNKDPFFHNVFSLFDGKRFDLGLYEAGSAKSVRFDRPGVSSLFCNIHPQMSAVVVTVDTPYYGVSDAEGRISIHEVPDGRYQLQVWSERSTPDSLKLAERVITISATTRDFGPIRILENPEFTLAHKNKYGQDYVLPSNPDYLPH